METTTATTAMQIKNHLESLEAYRGSRLLDLWDDEVFEVLASVAWVREALAESAPTLAPEAQRDVLFGLKTLAA